VWESFDEEAQAGSNLVSKVNKAPCTPTSLKEVRAKPLERITTDIDELDKVLGGGLVKGEVILVGGEPGVGKSTLLLEVGSNLAKKGKVLYVSAEESMEQIGLRARRLELADEELYLLGEDNLEEVYRYVKEGEFSYLFVDSIQVVYSPTISSPKGSPSQLKECAEFLTQIAKLTGIVVFIIGHVTKEGAIAGPKLLEHIVDCVLYFESEVLSTYRILRAVKNRFGPCGELAAFEMTSRGLRQLQTLSEVFLPHRDRPITGSCITCVIEGVRPIILELQALVSRASFGVVRRRCLGFDFNRFSLLVAVIEKRAKISFSNEDIFLSVSGGLRIADPSADLGAALAIISSSKEREILPEFVFLGEVGLGGELRPISNINLRLKEIARGGFRKVFIPQGNLKEIDKNLRNINIEPTSCLKEVLEKVW
jgi:DNA repair protein RadA/Sms